MSSPKTVNWWRLLLTFILVMIVASFANLAAPERAEAQKLPIPCGIIPDGKVEDVCDVVKDPVGAAPDVAEKITGKKVPGIPSPSEVVEDAAKQAANAVVAPILNELAKAEANAVLAVLGSVVKVVNGSTAPDTTARWFLKIYAILFGGACIWAIVMLSGRLTSAAANADPYDMGKAVTQFIVFFLVSASLPFLVGELVSVCDGKVAAGWMDLAGKEANATLKSMRVDFEEELSASNNIGSAILLPLVFLLFGLIGGVLVEIELLFRGGFLLVMICAHTYAHAMYIGGRWGGNALQRATMALIGLILFNVILAVILVISLKMFGAHDGVKATLYGSVMLLMVPIISVWAYKKISGHDVQVAGYIKDAVRAGRKRFGTSS